MEVMERVCQSAYGVYIRGVTTVAARYIGHPAVAIPASEMVKTMMEEAALPVNRPFVTITSEQMKSLKIEERRGEKEYIKTKDKREERERFHFSKPIRDMGLLWNRMWGYEDDAPILGQPFYDMTELFNDLSNYLEKSIIDSCEYTKKNFEEQAIQMYGDGEGAQILRALGGLEIEEELNLGGKIGAAGKGAMDFVGNGIASILLAAASPIETIKAITNAERPSQDEVVERVIQERKEFEKLSEQKKWEKRGYVAGETIDTILITRGILKGALKSISVDDFVEAGVKAGSKVDDIVEAGTKITSKVDDVAEAGANAADQTTATTVVEEISGVSDSGVNIKGKVSETDIDNVKVIGDTVGKEQTTEMINNKPEIDGTQTNNNVEKLQNSIKSNQYSGDLIKVDSPDAAADALAERIGGKSRVKFSNDPSAREFDVISDKYIAQAKPDLKGYGKSWRKQTKATFEAAKQTDKIPYFQFEGEPSPDIIKKIQEYSERYGIDYVIDTKPLGVKN